MKNIYDLEGNYREWTAEAGGTSYRACRGGNYDNASDSDWYPASSWCYESPTNTLGYNSSRPALYVNL